MELLLDADSSRRGLRRIAGEILEHRRADKLVLVGVRRGGVPIAERLADWIAQLDGHRPPVGAVDIGLYRDDAATALPSPRIGPSHIPVSVEHRTVILVDDVLFTGRTIRAAIEAVLDHGRPRRVELTVLVDRAGRELPIQANYCVRAVTVSNDAKILVEEDGDSFTARLASKTDPLIGKER